MAMNALQRLPMTEQDALLMRVAAEGMDVSQLACYMTRQQGSGRGTVEGGHFVRSYNIKYDLMLCRDCGSAFPLKVCPAKAQALKERLKELNPASDQQNLIDTPL